MSSRAPGLPPLSGTPTLNALTPVIEIGGTHVTAALVDTAARQVRHETVRHAHLDAAAPADEILAPILRCARGLGDRPGAYWGVAAPGPFDYRRGIARFTGVGKFDRLNGLDVRHALRNGLPAAHQRFCFLNDAHAFVLGEWWAGAASGNRRVVGITLGTGVGSAFMLDGTLIDYGDVVPPEGQVHLLKVNGRPLEESVSRRAILSRYAGGGAEAFVPGIDVREIAERARAGETAARHAIRDALHVLGAALAPWLVRFEAEIVVVGGSISRSWDLVAPPLSEGIESAGAPPGIVLTKAKQPADAALLGAAWHVNRAQQAGTGFGEK
ncbi:ROK family protein [Streptomyces sp. NPDC006475]|uniref:ROK family protein n=1 Tax=Streptomyces sp. NPDC006475 TaxID=3155719 RepID=UPI0033B3CDD7